MITDLLPRHPPAAQLRRRVADRVDQLRRAAGWPNAVGGQHADAAARVRRRPVDPAPHRHGRRADRHRGPASVLCREDPERPRRGRGGFVGRRAAGLDQLRLPGGLSDRLPARSAQGLRRAQQRGGDRGRLRSDRGAAPTSAPASDRAGIGVAAQGLRGQPDHPPGVLCLGGQCVRARNPRGQLPLALAAPETLDHRAACDAMDRAGRAYRIAFASNSLAGLLAVARSGQAISVITRSAVPGNLHVLGAPMPALPDIGISLAYASTRPSALVRAFGEFVATNLRPKGVGGTG